MRCVPGTPNRLHYEVITQTYFQHKKGVILINTKNRSLEVLKMKSKKVLFISLGPEIHSCTSISAQTSDSNVASKQ